MTFYPSATPPQDGGTCFELSNGQFTITTGLRWERMVYMVIYQASDGLWHVWDSPLAQHQVQWSVGDCLRTNGDTTPIKVIWATDTSLLGEVLKAVNEAETICLPDATEEVPWTSPSLLPAPRPYYELSEADKRRLDIENGKGGDHDTQEVYVRRDWDLLNWVPLLAKYQRGELKS